MDEIQKSPPILRYTPVIQKKAKFIYNMLADGVKPKYIMSVLKISKSTLYDYLMTAEMNNAFPKVDYTKLRREALSTKCRLLRTLGYKNKDIQHWLNVSDPTFWRLMNEVKPDQMKCWLLFKTTTISKLFTNIWVGNLVFVKFKDLETLQLEVKMDGKDIVYHMCVEEFLAMKPVLLDAFPIYTYIIKSPENPFITLKKEKV